MTLVLVLQAIIGSDVTFLSTSPPPPPSAATLLLFFEVELLVHLLALTRLSGASASTDVAAATPPCSGLSAGPSDRQVSYFRIESASDADFIGQQERSPGRSNRRPTAQRILDPTTKE